MRSQMIKMCFFVLLSAFCSLAVAKNVTHRTLASEAQREFFQCSMLVSHEFIDGMKPRTWVDIKQTVALGVGTGPLDLQPIFDGKALAKVYYGPLQVMGTLYKDQDGVKKIKLGFYLVAINKGSVTSEMYHMIPNGAEVSAFYAHPLAEMTADFESQDTYTLESTGVLGVNTAASFTQVKCQHQKVNGPR